MCGVHRCCIAVDVAVVVAAAAAEEICWAVEFG